MMTRPATFRFAQIPPLLLAVILSLALAPSAASAFSLGKIRVTGALEDSFRAEIPVRTDGKEGLTAEIGDQMDYDRVDAERPDFLDKFKIIIADHPMVAGQKIIYIRHDEPIYQPSFNLLIKAKLEGGVIMENYFLALDLQKNISMSLPSPERAVQAETSPADEEDLNKVAATMRALRPGQIEERKTLPESQPAASSQKGDMLEKIRQEEREQVEKERALLGLGKTPEREAKPVKIAEPAKAPAAAEPQRPKAAPIEVASITPAPEAPALLDSPIKSEPLPLIEERPAGMQQAKGGLLSHRFGGTVFAPLPADLENITIAAAPSPRTPVAETAAVASPTIVSAPAALPAPSRAPAASAALQGKPSSAAQAPKAPQAPAQTASIAPRPVGVVPARPVKTGDTAGQPSGGYLAIRGDNLFKIASSLGYGGAAGRQAVVALWMENKDKFIRGNMNGLPTGRTLSYSGVEERMKTVDARQASEIIKEQWAQWTGRSLPVLAALPKVAPREEPKRAVAARPEPIPAPAAAPAPTPAPQTEAPARLGGGKPYVVHVASFKTQEHSMEFVRLLRAKGFNAFEITCDIPGKGRWRRVVVDRLGGANEAQALGQAIKKGAISKYTQVLKLPYAISIDGPAPEDAARILLKKYEGKGLAPYALKDRQAGEYMILVGAYESKEGAAEDMTALSRLDLRPEIVQP